MARAFFRARFPKGILSISRQSLSRAASAKAYVIATIVAIGLLLAPMAWGSGSEGGPSPSETNPTLLMDLGFFVGGALRLGGVLILAFVSLQLLKAYQNHLGKHRPSNLRIIDSISLASQRSLYLVQAGDRQLLLGVTPSQITLLDEMPAQGPPEDDPFKEFLSLAAVPGVTAPPGRHRPNGHLRSTIAKRVLGSTRSRRLHSR